MIGQIYSSVTPYYDVRTGRNSFKRRPVLIISGPQNNDYTVLPVSTVSRKENLDRDFDIEVEPSDYPNLNLNHTCYIRTHKQTTVHKASLVRKIADMKSEYEDLYLEILEKCEEFHKSVIDNALSI